MPLGLASFEHSHLHFVVLFAWSMTRTPQFQTSEKSHPLPVHGHTPTPFPPPKIRKCHRTDEDIDKANPSHYIVHRGLRYAVPYLFHYRMHSKHRWLHRSLLNVFLAEFPHRGQEYWKQEIESGRILADGAPATSTTLWTDGLTLLHTVHRHESPVVANPIKIIYQDDSLLVVDKPSSIPVHPCGTYQRNSLTVLLAAYHSIYPLFTIHRLDKQTSGIVLLAKTRKKADELTAAMKECGMEKVYLARVKGNFPDHLLECEAPLFWDKRRLRASVREDGKSAKTRFRKLVYLKDDDETIVECRPVTGRSHQIRVHLMHLGHPISNDWTYLDTQDRKTRPESLGNCRVPNEEVSAGEVGWENLTELTSLGLVKAREEGRSVACVNCPKIANAKRFRSSEMMIYLHAREYRVLERVFCTELPSWAITSEPKDNQGTRSLR